jgi:hypothetical protein
MNRGNAQEAFLTVRRMTLQYVCVFLQERKNSFYVKKEALSIEEYVHGTDHGRTFASSRRDVRRTYCCANGHNACVKKSHTSRK